MIILQKGIQNELVLNINNNSRTQFSTYTLSFTNILSQEIKSYTIDTSNSQIYGENNRYCEIVLNFQNPGEDLNYEGQYELQIFGNGSELVYTGMARLEGNSEDNSFIQYISTDENNSNFIYIQE
jgi:hypothetical protein